MYNRYFSCQLGSRLYGAVALFSLAIYNWVSMAVVLVCSLISSCSERVSLASVCHAPSCSVGLFPSGFSLPSNDRAAGLGPFAPRLVRLTMLYFEKSKIQKAMGSSVGGQKDRWQVDCPPLRSKDQR